MPLSELVYKMFNPQPDSSKDENPSSSNDPSFVPENDFVELVWENGQIQSSRARKVQSIHTLTSQNPKIRDKDFGNHSGVKMGKSGTAEPVLNEIPMPVPSVEMGLNQDDDMVPWLNYSINESPQHDYCSEFLPELSGVTVNEHSSQNNFSSFGKSSADRLSRDSHTVSLHSGLSLDQGSVLKTSLGDNTRPRTSAAQLFPSPSQQYQSSIPDFRSRISINNGDSTRNQTSIAEMVNPTAGSCFPNLKMQKHTSVSPATNSSFMNFSHFSRPAALVKASIQNIGAKAGVGTPDITRIGAKAGVGTPDITRTGTKNKTSIASTANPSEFTRNVTSAELRNEPSSHCHPHMVLSKLDATSLDAKSVNRATPPEISVSANREDDSRNDKNYSQNFGESINKGFTDGEKTIEPGVASSSVCSGNSVERASDDPTQNLKRKNGDTEESEGPSEDVEEESVGIKKKAPARAGNGSKRSRAAEVHNLSERRRRDRINEKMRALQELIPNCNKVDKASMLDEAVEYLKTLQLQLKIMSMGSGIYMPSMMFPPGMPHMAHMAQFSPIGVGMGMGIGMGMLEMNACSSGSMMQMPPMHGTHFPGPHMPGSSAFHGMGASNFQMFGLPGQGLPMGFPPWAPLMPMSQGSLLKTNTLNYLDSAHLSGPKDSIQNINLQSEQNSRANNYLNQNVQVTNECFEQPSLTQCCSQVSEVTDNRGMQLTNGSTNETAGGSGIYVENIHCDVKFIQRRSKG